MLLEVSLYPLDTMSTSDSKMYKGIWDLKKIQSLQNMKKKK